MTFLSLPKDSETLLVKEKDQVPQGSILYELVNHFIYKWYQKSYGYSEIKDDKNYEYVKIIHVNMHDCSIKCQQDH